MVRLTLDGPAVAGVRLSLGASDRHYLMDVMRRRPGDMVEVLTRDGGAWTARISEDGSVVLEEPAATVRDPRRQITLYQALLKGDHFGAVVDRATQAGVSRIVPIVTSRCIVREVSQNKRTRWELLAKEAAEQSQRRSAPAIDGCVPLAALTQDPDALAYVLHPEAPQARPWLENDDRPVRLVIGPEGGLSPDELQHLTAKGFAPLSLGPLVYRAENAGAFGAVLFLQ